MRVPTSQMPSQFAVLVAALVGHLRVPLRAGRVDRELVAVALVVERVDDDLEAVGVAGVEVLAQLVDDDLARLVVLGEHADVERAVVVEQRTSVSKVAGSPSCGSFCMKSLAIGAFAHDGSSSRPSSSIGDVARTAATACGSSRAVCVVDRIVSQPRTARRDTRQQRTRREHTNQIQRPIA